MPAALTAYRDALAIAERLGQSDPGDLERQRHLSLLHEKIGDVLMAQGNEPDALPNALTSYRSGLDIRKRLAHLEPNATSQRELSASFHKVGDVLMARGNLIDALKFHRDGLAIRNQLAQHHPSNAEWQHDLSVSYDKVGDVMAQASGEEPNQLDDDTHSTVPMALTAYRSSLAIRERLAQADLGNAAWQRDLSVSYDRIGDIKVEQGDLAGALKLYREGLAISERLFTAPSDPEAHRLSAVGRIGSRDLIVSYVKIAEVDRSQAKAMLARARDLAYGAILALRDDWIRDDVRRRIANLPA